MSVNKIIIAVNLPEETQRPLHFLRGFPYPPKAEIQLVHMVTESVYAAGMESVQTFPSGEAKKKLEEQILAKLEQLRTELFSETTMIVTKVIFDSNVRKGFTEYVTNQGAELVIVATRGRLGMKDHFDSSFAQYQVKYSTANVLILR
jgi:nucleotide-binding universal stress UspA family protein